MPEPRRALATAAGELEVERFSRRANGGEALGVYALLQLSLWGLIAPAQAAGAGGGRGLLGHALLAGCALYMGALAPILHGDRAEALGLPDLRANRAALGRAWRGAGPERRAAGASALLAALLLLRGWPNLLARLGLRRHFPELFDAWVRGVPGVALPLLAAAPVAFVLGAGSVRWENLRPAARALVPGVLGLALAVLGAAAWIVPDGGGPAVPGPGLRAQRAGEIFYLLWALVQQHLFLGYFNARLRRSLAPRPGSRFLVALANGVGFGLLHLPALHLCASAALCQALLAWHFQRRETRNLFAAAAAHAALGALYAQLLPLSMDVGPWP